MSALLAKLIVLQMRQAVNLTRSTNALIEAKHTSAEYWEQGERRRRLSVDSMEVGRELLLEAEKLLADAGREGVI